MVETAAPTSANHNGEMRHQRASRTGMSRRWLPRRYLPTFCVLPTSQPCLPARVPQARKVLNSWKNRSSHVQRNEERRIGKFAVSGLPKEQALSVRVRECIRVRRVVILEGGAREVARCQRPYALRPCAKRKYCHCSEANLIGSHDGGGEDSGEGAREEGGTGDSEVRECCRGVGSSCCMIQRRAQAAYYVSNKEGGRVRELEVFSSGYSARRYRHEGGEGRSGECVKQTVFSALDGVVARVGQWRIGRKGKGAVIEGRQDGRYRLFRHRRLEHIPYIHKPEGGLLQP